MKVFSREVFDKLEGQNAYTWVTKCNGKTKKECEKLGYGILDEWCIDIPDFVKGQEIETSDNKKWWIEKIFYSYDSSLEFPYLTKSMCGSINSFKYARAIEPKYVPYKEPKLEWIGKEVKDGFGDLLEITSIGKPFVVLEDDNNIPFDYLLKHFQWSDGTPCGEKEK